MEENKIYHWITAEYFEKVLSWIIIINGISGIIAIGVILFLYNLWKKSEEANVSLYIQNKELNEKAERMQNGN